MGAASSTALTGGLHDPAAISFDETKVACAQMGGIPGAAVASVRDSHIVQSSLGRTSWAKRSIASSATSSFSGTKSRVKCSAPTSM